MGKGDKRTRRGKIFAGSFGKTRPHKAKKAAFRPTTKAGDTKKAPPAKKEAKK